MWTYGSKTHRVLFSWLRPAGPLHILSGYLMWLQDEAVTVVSDLNGRNVSILEIPANRRTSAFTVVDPAQRRSLTPSDERGNAIDWIPDPVPGSSITVTEPQLNGSYRLNISWQPVRNVDSDRVQYEIHIRNQDHDQLHLVTNASSCLVQPNWKPNPCTTLMVSIKAFSVWGSSPTISTNLRMPQLSAKAGGLPQPGNFSATILTPHSVRLKWEKPKHLGGTSISFTVSWKGEMTTGQRSVDSTTTVVDSLLPGHTYTFRVRASFCGDQMLWSESSPLTLDTYRLPSPLILRNATTTSLILQWTPPKEVILKKYV